ncbi:MAG: phosphoribosyltransferase [Chloroflexota bacterium]|nr:MAG: phosphoribosyltransferase [Chloroflexota bacterium]
MVYRDRSDAGCALAAALARYRDRDDVLVLALPRGGVPVGFEVAMALGCPLDVFVVRKLGVPDHPEWAFGAIGSGGARVLNQDVVRSAGITADEIERVTLAEQGELERRERLYRAATDTVNPRDRAVILVDDGLATGATMRAAIVGVRQRHPSAVVVAVPVGSPRAVADVAREADEVICPAQPWDFQAVGLHYANFEATGDDEARALLDEARRRFASIVV